MISNYLFYIFISLSYFSYTQKDISGKYKHYYNDRGFSETILLELKKDSTFQYKEINDQICYTYTKTSRGNWKIQNDTITFLVDDDLLPRVEYKNSFEKKDTLTLKSFSVNGKDYNKWWYLYDFKNNLISLPNFNNHGFKKEISDYQKIKKIQLGHYFKFSVDEIKGDINVTNISDEIIFNFDELKLLIKKNKLKSTKKISGPTKRVRKVFKKIK